MSDELRPMPDMAVWPYAKREHHELRIVTYNTPTKDLGGLLTSCPCSWTAYGNDLTELIDSYREHLP